jgi:DNA invertase Pin-like site-specific DNA recombinase
MKYGYARISPGGKSESVDAQARDLTKAGCKKVFRDVHVSGAKTDRAQLRRAIAELEPGDVLMVTRLATRDLLNTLAAGLQFVPTCGSHGLVANVHWEHTFWG